MEELKSRLEVLLGSRPEAPLKEEMKAQVVEAVSEASAQRRERVAAAGGELLGAAFKLLGELVTPAAAPPDSLVASLRLQFGGLRRGG